LAVWLTYPRIVCAELAGIRGGALPPVTLQREMRVLITGAAGMLGLDVKLAAAAAGHDVTALSRAQLDITDFDAVTRAVSAARPDAVINCAAYTNVDGAETDPATANAINGDGAGVLAVAAAGVGAWMVHVSTDYVFDGTAVSPYLESAKVGPRSVYGSSKLLGEEAVAEAALDSHTIVRSSWLFGVGGPCFPDTILRLADQRSSLNVVDDQLGCPTFTPHLAAALVRLASERSLVGIAHVAGAGACTWFEFARALVSAAAADCQVRPCTTAEFPRPAARPAYSVLRSERGAPELPEWRTGLAQYMAARAEVTRAGATRGKAAR